MASIATNFPLLMNKFKTSRRGRKLLAADDQRLLIALPKEIPERTWAEILQKEENDLFIFDLREEIVEAALEIGYQNYMERQTALFTAHCAAEAWLKLINWHFYRHDPGEDPSAYPPCYIPKREESWTPDEMPAPSPKDTWCQQDLVVVEETLPEGLQRWTSSESVQLATVEDIPEEFWFPGKVQMRSGRHHEQRREYQSPSEMARRRPRHPPPGPDYDTSVMWVCESSTSSSESSPSERQMAIESEVLQKVTDYSSTEDTHQVSTHMSDLKTTTPANGSLQGAGDSAVDRQKTKRRLTDKLVKPSFLGSGRTSMAMKSAKSLAHLSSDSRSRITLISDCRLRNLRLDTQFEVSSEKMDTPPGETVKRK